MQPFSFYLETYGCRVNQCESQAIVEAWQRAGGTLTPFPSEADYIIINSCAITGRAERHARNAVTRLRRQAPAARIILAGCAAQFYLDFQPRKNAPWTVPDICIAQREKSRLLAGPALNGADSPFPRISSSSRARPVVKIQDGCSHCCSYCIVPQTRGRPRSLKPPEILRQCRELARHGYGEIVISGINLRQYAGNFWDMLRQLDARLTEEFASPPRIRLSSLDPAQLNSEAIEVLASGQLFCRHLHLSLQHASGRILRAMRRSHYDLANVSDFVDALRIHWPLFGLGADFIIGFPGETEADLEILLRFIEKFPLTYAHVFPYSRRQGTKAAAMPMQLPKKVKEERALQVRAAIAQKKTAFLQRQLELPQVVMAVERRGGDRSIGVNEFYSQCAFDGPLGDDIALFAGRPVRVEQGILQLEAIGTRFL